MIKRRRFLQYSALAGLSANPGFGLFNSAMAAGGSARIVIIGGGFGGATCARYLAQLNPGIHITLVDRAEKFVTCPFSNAVIGGLHDISYITHSFDKLRQDFNIKVVNGEVRNIDPAGKKVILKKGKSLEYDRLVISPGVDFKWNAIEGYDRKAAQQLPHAWHGGPQTQLLRQQLLAMKDGGVVIIAPPNNPFRCPPGPYERASLVANYLKQHKPKSKIVILDAKDKFSKQALFQDAWDKLYGEMIEWVPGSQGGTVTRVDVKNKTVFAGGDKHQGAVINIIPPQQAGGITHTAGLADDSGWCPVNQRTFASTRQQDIYIVGDACIAGKMPKSGYAANSQAKVCAVQITASLQGLEEIEPSWVNTCYSLVAPDYGISVAAVYRHSSEGIIGVDGAGGVGPRHAEPQVRSMEAVYAEGWYKAIVKDIWG